MNFYSCARCVSVLFLLIVYGGGVSAQIEVSPEPVDSVPQLHFMKGSWKGEGWIMGKDRQLHRFSQTEVIQDKMNGRAFTVDGLGYAIDSTGQITGSVIHEAFGVISVNPDKKKVTMISFSEMYGRMESDLYSVGDKKLQWSFTEPVRNATIRFTEDFSEGNVWKETGEISMDGSTWYPFFSMQLKKE